MGRKKKLKEKDFLEILKTNSKENPFDIDNFDKQSIIDCKKNTKNLRTALFVKFTCTICKKQNVKNINQTKQNTIETISYCKLCKTEKTNLIRYNAKNPQQNSDIQSKTRKTNKRKYGVENAYQIDYVVQKQRQSTTNNIDLIQQKRIKTTREHLGVDFPMQSEDVKNKSKETVRKNWNVDNVGQHEEIIKKRENTNMINLGVKNAFQSDIIKDKIKQTNLKNLGVEHNMQSKEIQEKAKQTKLEKYNKLSFNYIYKYNSVSFDSSWELAFYIYHKDKGNKIKHEPCNFSYTYKNVEHLYFPDFKVNNKYYEIKGEQFIERYKNGNIKTLVCPFDHSLDKLYNTKYKCMKKHNVTIIDCNRIQKYLEYIIDTYGEDYLDQFRVD